MKTLYMDESFQLPDELKNGSAATVGFFDGVHLGHRFLIRQLQRTAQQSNLPVAVITFPVHPRKVLQANYQPELLCTLEEKLFRLSTTGVDYCIIMNFTKALSELSAKDFIIEKLHNELNIKQLLIGYDHKFGKGRVDGFEDYRIYGEMCGMKVIQAEEWQQKDLHVSSTTIRHLLAEGNVSAAAGMLSYPYSMEGNVITGNQMGRTIGFPTANIELQEENKVIPRNGIYATWVQIGETTYRGMTYIGNRPTILPQGEKRIEVHILDFSGDLYGQFIRLEFIAYLRDDKRFDRMEDLQKQLVADKRHTLQVLQ